MRNRWRNQPAGGAVPATASSPRIVENRVVRDEDEQGEKDDPADSLAVAGAASASPSQQQPLQAVRGYFDMIESDETDSACEDDIDEEDESDEKKGRVEPVQLASGDDRGKLSRFLSDLKSRLPPRTVNFLTRGLSGLGLIAAFVTIVSIGPLGLLMLSFMVLTKSFGEVMHLGYRQCGVSDKRTQRFCWFIFFLAVYLLDAPACLSVLQRGLQQTPTNHGQLQMENQSQPMVKMVTYLKQHHPAIVFMSYLVSIAWFVTSMKTKNYLGRYALFGWCHTTVLLTVVPVHMINQTLFSGGMIYYVNAMIIITINDICAYYVGFFCGKRPLIKLSPKKTLEGYVGGGLLTLVIGTLFSLFTLQFAFLQCPAEVRPSFVTKLLTSPLEALFNERLFSVDHCQMPAAQIFVPVTYKVNNFDFVMAPFVLHGFVISAFASILGPIGGFLASGFKRACNRKNFGSLIPGHGGVVDRCDCMFLMAAFINVYLNSIQPHHHQPITTPS